MEEHEAWIRALTLLLTSWLIWGRSLNLSGFGFLYLKQKGGGG